MMLGWDGLGVVSYVLVVYYKNEKSRRAGIITALRNRVGDAALILSIACFLEIGRWNYMSIKEGGWEMIWLLVGLAAITKSAQIPFSAWLPAAIAAPTPVSALVHSSTLVTAGVYLLIRFRGLITGSLTTEALIYLGLSTTLMARMRAIFEVDFKKIVALSTLRQLGIMVTTLSIGFVELSFIHLLIHAIFKALLFICRGKLIHIVGDNQDIRKIGGLIFNLPITGVIIRISRLALCGVPFISGFYSKDLIIESIEIRDSFFTDYIIYILVVGFTARYSIRLIYLSSVCRVNQGVSRAREDNDLTMLVSKAGLLVFSLIRGALLMWLIIPSPTIVRLRLGLKWLAFFSICLGFFIGIVFCIIDFKGERIIKNLGKVEVFITIWNLPSLSGRGLVIIGGGLRIRFKSLDLGWTESLSGKGWNSILLGIGGGSRVWVSRGVKNFIIIFIVALCVIKFFL